MRIRTTGQRVGTPSLAAVIAIVVLTFSSPLIYAGAQIEPQETAAVGPFVDLNGPETPGLDFADTIFIEDGGPVNITAPDLQVTSDREQTVIATISLDYLPDSPFEILDVAADLEGTGLVKTYNVNKGILTISGKGSIDRAH